MKGIGGHQSAKARTVEWLTPPDLKEKLGSFDLDPCSPVNRPWDTAKVHYTKRDNGLTKPWFGDVWLNPPYDRGVVGLWLSKMAEHGRGVALIFARTETEDFFRYVFNNADSILFIKGRLHFYNQRGERANANSGAPSVLIAYGENNVERLHASGIPGKHLLLHNSPKWCGDPPADVIPHIAYGNARAARLINSSGGLWGGY
ncbi:MAG TPA: DNA N-6-adenine-methyltransferase [Anaerovoracaceae bacterium]|nr:DNA N-6-adenine-methyltransferase [Anaerovoracaceae bacterium]